MRRLTLIVTIAAGLFFGTSCSKTEDTAPETRLFGNPPQIQNVNLSTSGGLGTATCDYTKILEGFLCEQGGISRSMIEGAFPNVTITTQFSELQFDAVVSDPDSVPGGQTDILLVSASYQRVSEGGTPVEVSLVLLDDGSSNSFNYTQGGIEIEEKCVDEPPGSVCGDPSVGCSLATYPLASNDPTANDGTYTRGFALVSGVQRLTEPTNISPGTKFSVALNCIAMNRKEFPAITLATIGTGVTFKIEAVDRAGNLATWPSQPQATFDQTTFSCTSDVPGDTCSCCILLSSLLDQDCKGRTGLQGVPGSGFEQGFCIATFGS